MGIRVTRDKVLITGGAGFIGSNLANRLISQGFDVAILDNLSRPGSAMNLRWLLDMHGQCSFRFIKSSLNDYETLLSVCMGVKRIYHLAGQVAVTTSVMDPRKDFIDNALGTFNLLEAARHCGDNPILLYASTNKVYGNMASVDVFEDETRYQYKYLKYGISESQLIDFHSP